MNFNTVVDLIVADLLGMNAGGQGAALGFQFFGGPVITLLASKTSRRCYYCPKNVCCRAFF